MWNPLQQMTGGTTMWAGPEKAPADSQAQACLEAIHRVVRSNAPDAYPYLCDKLPLVPPA